MTQKKILELLNSINDKEELSWVIYEQMQISLKLICQNQVEACKQQIHSFTPSEIFSNNIGLKEEVINYLDKTHLVI